MKKFDFNIYLIGFMGAGKSTIAKALQSKLDMDVVEMDQMIVDEQGMAITDIFEKYGEDHFRDIETETLKKLKKKGSTIVSCGGGIVVRDQNAGLMKEDGKVIFLTARPETILGRVKDSTDRPILNGNMNVEFIEGLMTKRKDKYMAVADYQVATDGKNSDEISDEIIGLLS